MIYRQIMSALHQFGLWLVSVTAHEGGLPIAHAADPDQSLSCAATIDAHGSSDGNQSRLEFDPTAMEPPTSFPQFNEECKVETMRHVIADQPPEVTSPDDATSVQVEAPLAVQTDQDSKVEQLAVASLTSEERWLLGVLETQLQEVNVDIETSVNGVCATFKSMADRGRLALDAAENGHLDRQPWC